MDQLVQHLPYDALGKRTFTLDQNALVVRFKSLNRSFSDEYRYTNINPDFKFVKRGAGEWSGVIYGLVVFSIVLFLAIKMAHGFVLKCAFLGIQFSALVAAVWLLGLRFVKREYCCVFDSTGDCIMCVKTTPASKEFLRKLRTRLANGEVG